MHEVAARFHQNQAVWAPSEADVSARLSLIGDRVLGIGLAVRAKRERTAILGSLRGGEIMPSGGGEERYE